MLWYVGGIFLTSTIVDSELEPNDQKSLTIDHGFASRKNSFPVGGVMVVLLVPLAVVTVPP